MGRFDAVLGAHTSVTNKITARGAILVCIIKLIIVIEGDSKAVQYKLYLLGKSHAQKGIRPW